MVMDNILAVLLTERDKLDRAIAALEGPRRRGRPPGRRGPGRPAKKRGWNMSPAVRKAASKRMKAYWAARRKKKKG